MVERQGFEPWELLHSMVFKTTAFGHSATSPKRCELYRGFTLRQPKKVILLGILYINHYDSELGDVSVQSLASHIAIRLL